MNYLRRNANILKNATYWFCTHTKLKITALENDFILEEYKHSTLIPSKVNWTVAKM